MKLIPEKEAETIDFKPDYYWRSPFRQAVRDMAVGQVIEIAHEEWFALYRSQPSGIIKALGRHYPQRIYQTASRANCYLIKRLPDIDAPAGRTKVKE